MTRVERLRAAERGIILEALVAHQGSRTKAAAALGDPGRTFASRLAALLTAAELADLAALHGWPPATAAATAARLGREG